MKEYGTYLIGVKTFVNLEQRDRFGFYQVGDYKTYSKLEAIQLHEKTGIHPTWNFNQEVFSKFDWTQEPHESLQELYRRRAQQIRDRYDYLVLFYSGGADSKNILDTFIDNNIKLDECASFWAQEADRNLDSHFSKEVARVAIPDMAKHKDIKHRIIDLVEVTNKVLGNSDIKFEWIYFVNNMFSPNNFVRNKLRRLIPEYKRMIDSGKSVCFIWGSEKPRVHFANGKYAIRFQDVIDNCVSPYLQQYSLPGEADELFYWSPDFVEGIIKQAHVIKRFLRQGPLNDLFWNSKPGTHNYGSAVRKDKTYYLSAHGLNLLIYPKWDHTTISVGKPSSIVWSERDEWFFKSQSWNSAAINWQNGIEKLNQILKTNEYWTVNKGNISGGLQGCVSDSYFLE